VFDCYRDWVQDPSGHFCPCREHCDVAIARHHRGRAGACACRGANRRTFSTADDSSDDRAHHSTAANLCSTLVGRRIAEAIDRFGRDRETRSVGHHERLKSDTKAGSLLEFSTAIDGDDGANRVRACRDRHFAADTNVANHVRLDAIFYARPLTAERRINLQSDDGICRDDKFFERLDWRF
jgi:hypothetical protein